MSTNGNKHVSRQSGQLLILVLVFGAIFLIVVSSFIGTVVSQARAVDVRFEQQRATEIAEAGLNYYKWYLSHYPGDTSGDGSTQVYSDIEDGPIGEFSLSIASTSYCGVVSSLEVESTGYTYANPNALAIVSARYARPTVADYSFINNAATWYGDSRVITGPVHGNQGVKMDGTHNSSVGSGQATWNCTGSFGCNPDIPAADGVHTDSGLATPGLFEYPVSPIDFAGLTIDLAQMRTSAQSGGVFYDRVGTEAGTSGGDNGYHLIFNGDGTFDVYVVTNTSSYWAYSSYEGWHTSERNDIAGETLLANNVTIPTECPVLFFEDKVWIEGDVDQKVAVGAALNTSNTQNNIVLHNYIDYVPGADAGLLAIAEDDVDVGLEVQDDMVANGIFIAQNGRFGRNHYSTAYLPSSLDPYVSRNSLTRLGSVVSNTRGGTEWTSGGSHISGFQNRITSFDRDQVDNPPPLTPETNDVYELQDWRQEG